MSAAEYPRIAVDHDRGAHATLRLLVDAYSLGDDSQRRGIGGYLRIVLTGIAGSEDLVVGALCLPGADIPPSVRVHTIRRLRHPRVAAALHRTLLTRAPARRGYDLLWCPAQHPAGGARPWVQTLHDLTPLVFPHPVLAADARAWRRLAPRLRAARAIITPSRATAEQAERLLRVDPERLRVIPHGVSPQFRPDGSALVRARPYVLLAGAWGPHKGFEDALEAVAGLAQRGLPHELVLAGFGNSWMQAQVDALVRAAPRPDRVVRLGWVDDLAAVYRGAAAVVVPSRAEGFCLPLLEAMACGTPVAGYANTALPEVSGGAALLVPDGDRKALAEALVQLVIDPLAADRARQAGLARAAHFSWDASIEAHLAVFREVARGG
ncbi:MAG: glycosyltransferase family 4 protein [Mycobacteriales bacterium]